MEHAKKMAILPQSLVASLMNQQLLGNQGIAYLGELDGQMKSIMDDRNIPADIKAKQYGNVLNRFLQMRGNELKDSSGIQFGEQSMQTPQTVSAAPVIDNEVNLLTTVAGRNKNKAKILLDHVKNNPDLTWNAQQQLVYKGVPVPNSNLPDLLNQYSRPGNRNEIGFAGYREFGKALSEHNTHRTAVVNRKLLDKAIEEENEEQEVFVSPTGGSNSSPILNSSGEGTSQQRKRSRVFTRSRNPDASTPKARNQWTTWR